MIRAAKSQRVKVELLHAESMEIETTTEVAGEVQALTAIVETEFTAVQDLHLQGADSIVTTEIVIVIDKRDARGQDPTNVATDIIAVDLDFICPTNR